jgi:hypothetical protein
MIKNRFACAITVIAAILALTALPGCTLLTGGITGSGTIVTQEFDFSDFDEVEIDYAFEGTITQGDAYSVVVRVDDNLVDRLRVEQNGNRVSIGLESTGLITRATMEYEITMPNLNHLSVDGAGNAHFIGFNSAEAFTGAASGAARIEGDLSAGDLVLEASGASTISLAGTAGDVNAEASGASTIDLEELTAANVDAIASGASTVTANTGGTLNAEASGASNVYYLGDPTLGNIEESGGSNVQPR